MEVGAHEMRKETGRGGVVWVSKHARVSRGACVYLWAVLSPYKGTQIYIANITCYVLYIRPYLLPVHCLQALYLGI
jgi:hypothetical protein